LHVPSPHTGTQTAGVTDMSQISLSGAQTQSEQLRQLSSASHRMFSLQLGRQSAGQVGPFSLPVQQPSRQASGQTVGQLHAVSPGSQVAPQVAGQSEPQFPLVSAPVQQPSPQTSPQSAGQLHAVSGGSANSLQIPLPQTAWARASGGASATAMKRPTHVGAAQGRSLRPERTTPRSQAMARESNVIVSPLASVQQRYPRGGGGGTSTGIVSIRER